MSRKRSIETINKKIAALKLQLFRLEQERELERYKEQLRFEALVDQPMEQVQAAIQPESMLTHGKLVQMEDGSLAQVRTMVPMAEPDPQ